MWFSLGSEGILRLASYCHSATQLLSLMRENRGTSAWGWTKTAGFGDRRRTVRPTYVLAVFTVYVCQLRGTANVLKTYWLDVPPYA